MTDKGGPHSSPAVRIDTGSDPVPATLREAMAQFATGITVVTVAGERPHGMTANAFTSVSLTPPLVLCCVKRATRMHESITSSGSFAVSMLGADQEHLARYFANRHRPSGITQFDIVPWVPGPYTGAPLLTGSLAWLECELTEAYDGGDHSIFLGKVLTACRVPDQKALVFYCGNFHRVA